MNAMHMYFVRLNPGYLGDQLAKFYENVSELGAVNPGVSGNLNPCLVAYSGSGDQLAKQCLIDVKNGADLLFVEEITDHSLSAGAGHRVYADKIKRVFFNGKSVQYKNLQAFQAGKLKF
ncbi:hypothetical protein Q9Q94_10370 [Uliginosibacterium sp. 31-16]|uniref:hypothetical protein n=1 Tax=Uliginosibacterium sp. 31-16 TaxID=3068315 RepID=UPI00273E30A1|nr:hypothetical protein [Uliginosibacterium sp. 31-16]MDP5239940.1 hypothetical protein [Uliginosibacterium sp. 31-16]